MNYTLQNKNMIVTVSSSGAEIISVKAFGRERSWQNDNNTWGKHAPILFPYAGKCHVVVNGKEYFMQQHGFARNLEHQLVKQSKNTLQFKLLPSDYTKNIYPYDFEFYTTYTLKGETIFITNEIVNPSNENIYFALGAHDSFNTFDDIKDFKLSFEKDEVFNACNHNDFGYLTGEITNYGVGKDLILPEDYLCGNTIIMPDVNSRKVALVNPQGKTLVEITYPDFAGIMVWRPKDAKMICIEPWTNMPDNEKQPKCEFKYKYGVKKVEPNSFVKLDRSIKYFNI